VSVLLEQVLVDQSSSISSRIKLDNGVDHNHLTVLGHPELLVAVQLFFDRLSHDLVFRTLQPQLFCLALE
jgi:hypothetical protein